MPLRFGIEYPRFEDTLPRIFTDGVLDISRLDAVEIMREKVGLGYEVIEVTLDFASILPTVLTPESVQKLADLKDELKHSYTVHLPLWSVEPATFNEEVRKGSVDSTVNAIELAEPLDPETYVLHATGSLGAEFSRLNFSPDAVDLICMYMTTYASTSLEEIIAKSEIDTKKLALENVEFPFRFTRELADEYDTGICFDTGHLMARYSGDESLSEFYKTHKDRIIEIHLQDGFYGVKNDAIVKDDHIPIGRGQMPVREFMMELVKDRFKKPVVFELTATEAEESKQHLREVVPEVFA
ncbi:MAG: sugar phosphate isomerase/epimerase [Candidatus Thorarchaeota archaeon]|nr:MAG: sugar phosphate isomerase/epimerase [Candidatus Thorarchaeota archaeon]